MLNIKDPIQQGYILVPDGPGLGVEIDEDVIRKQISFRRVTGEKIPEGEALWL